MDCPFGESKLMPITDGSPGKFIVHPFKPNVNYYDSNGDLSAQYHGGHSHDGMTPHGHNAGPGLIAMRGWNFAQFHRRFQ